MQARDGRLSLSPSDLNDHVECAHLTTLALEVARGTRPRPHVPEDHVDLLRRKGEEHEAAYLAALRAQGKQVVDVIGADRWDFEGSARATLEAMRAGAEVIYQATFVLGDWRGRADFLERGDERWRREDHLVLVAGIRGDQVARLRSARIATLTQLAKATPGTTCPDVAAHTFETLHDQAALQLTRRTTGEVPWHPLLVESGRGFDRLPRPSPGDVIFDIEGDPFWEPARGLHFLFGLLTRDDGDWQYRTFWAHDREGERRQFEALIDFFRERLARHPDLHVYHYGAYEPTALKQLMGVYATREDAVDDLLRGEVFVDLHAVVRQGLRAGVSGYSLKEVEALPAFQRHADVKSGTRAVLAYERWMQTRTQL